LMLVQTLKYIYFIWLFIWSIGFWKFGCWFKIISFFRYIKLHVQYILNFIIVIHSWKWAIMFSFVNYFFFHIIVPILNVGMIYCFHTWKRHQEDFSKLFIFILDSCNILIYSCFKWFFNCDNFLWRRLLC